MKFPKTIRFDNSDLNIFENPSEEGEWAISGAFEFSNDIKENLKGKRKQSFSNGFLGLDSFGRSTFVSISSIDEPEKIIIVKKLAELFVQSYGAPDIIKASSVAEEEVNFMIDVCSEHDLGSLLTVFRTLENDGIHEKFRHIPKGDACSNQKIWTTVTDEN